MTDDDLPQFLAALKATLEVYERKLTDAAASMWFEVLSEEPLDRVQRALTAYMRDPANHSIPPRPPAILAYIRRDAGQEALAAWSKVDAAVRRIGTWPSVVFDDPIIHACIEEMGGWAKFGEVSAKEWGFMANEFRNRYEAHHRLGVGGYPAVLSGCGGPHYNDGQPVLIGCERAATRVLGGGERRLIPAPGESTSVQAILSAIALQDTGPHERED